MSISIIRAHIPWYTCQLIEFEADGNDYIFPCEPFHGEQPLPRSAWIRIVRELQKSIDAFSDTDIEDHIQSIEQKRKERSEAFTTGFMKNYRARHGFVYVIQGDNYFKIGCTINPQKRIKTMSVKSPFELKIRLLLPSDNIDKLEKELHDKFHDKRQKGEWFTLTEEDIGIIALLYPTTDITKTIAS